MFLFVKNTCLRTDAADNCKEALPPENPPKPQSPGPATAADSAFSRKPREIAQSEKILGSFPNLGKIFFGHITAVQVEKTAGFHDSPVGDKAKTRAAQTSPGHGIQAVGFEGHFFAFFF